jgi:hypothetical protein
MMNFCFGVYIISQFIYCTWELHQLSTQKFLRDRCTDEIFLTVVYGWAGLNKCNDCVWLGNIKPFKKWIQYGILLVLIGAQGIREFHASSIMCCHGGTRYKYKNGGEFYNLLPIHNSYTQQSLSNHTTFRQIYTSSAVPYRNSVMRFRLQVFSSFSFPQAP